MRTPGGQPGAAGSHQKSHPESSNSDAQRKRQATVIAHLALAGVAVYELAGGGFLLAWRGLSRECPDLDALEAHARLVGALR